MVGGSHGVLAINTASSVCKKGSVCCEAVDNKRQGGAAAVAEEEHGRSVKMENEDGNWE